MRIDRRVLLTVLVYVTFDLCLPGSPGAFAFEPSECVEIVRMTRERAAFDVVSLSTVGRDCVMTFDGVHRSVVAPRVRLPDHGARTVRSTDWLPWVSPIARARSAPAGSLASPEAH
jgi:hypothetical protein